MMPLDVVGGVYREVVVIPEHVALLGSAGRAAVALGPDRAQITLHTTVSESDRNDLDRLAESNGFKLQATQSQCTMKFNYMHGLDSPRIDPAPHLITNKPSITIEASNILCFGALDFDWKVQADCVVYDPQDAFNARSFKSTSSSAKRLAVVLNQYEAKRISGKTAVEDQLSEIFLIDEPDVVILKCGANGTVVATASGGRETIPPIITSGVFKIGSGDVFSSMFAWAWINQSLSAKRSAEIAAQATAYYVSTRTIPLPASFEQDNIEYKNKYAKLPPRDNACLYLASPFFTVAERWIVEEARLYLQDCGVTVFSPVHDVGPGKAEVVVEKDLSAIRDSDVIFAVVSGCDPGTLFEIGYARALGKPVVVFVENEKHEDIKMLIGSGCTIRNDFASSIYAAAWIARFPE